MTSPLRRPARAGPVTGVRASIDPDAFGSFGGAEFTPQAMTALAEVTAVARSAPAQRGRSLAEIVDTLSVVDLAARLELPVSVVAPAVAAAHGCTLESDPAFTELARLAQRRGLEAESVGINRVRLVPRRSDAEAERVAGETDLRSARRRTACR